jgi:hypothetical protein
MDTIKTRRTWALSQGNLPNVKPEGVAQVVIPTGSVSGVLSDILLFSELVPAFSQSQMWSICSILLCSEIVGTTKL